MAKGFLINGIQHYTPKEAYALCKEGAILVDVREEYMNGHKCFDVEKLLFHPYSELEKTYHELDKEAKLIYADASGLKSIEAVKLCIKKGMTNVANMTGGLVEWERDGLPITTNLKERLSGSCMCQIKYRDIDK